MAQLRKNTTYDDPIEQQRQDFNTIQPAQAMPNAMAHLTHLVPGVGGR